MLELSEKLKLVGLKCEDNFIHQFNRKRIITKIS